MSDFSEKDKKKEQNNIPAAENSSSVENPGQTMMPPSFNPQTSQSPIQKKDKDEDAADKKGVDIDVKLLPPSVQMAFWRFKMSGDIGGAKLGYKQDDFSSALGYSYGSDFSLGMKKGPFSLGGTLNPGSLDYGMKAGYKQGNFNAGLRYSSKEQKGTFSLGLGAPLLPMPDVFGSAMQSGGDAATNMMMQGPMAPLNDPMAYYKSNKDNIGDISKAAGMAAKLAKQNKGVKFGAGVSLSASQLSGFAIKFGIQGSF
jgi:hypothetical protein